MKIDKKLINEFIGYTRKDDRECLGYVLEVNIDNFKLKRWRDNAIISVKFDDIKDVLVLEKPGK